MLEAPTSCQGFFSPLLIAGKGPRTEGLNNPGTFDEYSDTNDDGFEKVTLASNMAT